MQITIQEFDYARKSYYRAILICDRRIEEACGKSVKEATLNVMARWMNKYRNKKK